MASSLIPLNCIWIIYNLMIPAQSPPSQTTLNKHICFGLSAKSSNTSLKYICFARRKSLAKTATFAEFHNICTLNSDTDQRPLFRFTQLPPPNFHSVPRGFCSTKVCLPSLPDRRFSIKSKCAPVMGSPVFLWYVNRSMNGWFYGQCTLGIQTPPGRSHFSWGIWMSSGRWICMRMVQKWDSVADSVQVEKIEHDLTFTPPKNELTCPLKKIGWKITFLFV